MNRNEKRSIVLLLGLLLVMQPAAHCFSLDDLKSSLLYPFELFKPYCTIENLAKTTLIGSVLCFFGFDHLSRIMFKAND